MSAATTKPAGRGADQGAACWDVSTCYGINLLLSIYFSLYHDVMSRLSAAFTFQEPLRTNHDRLPALICSLSAVKRPNDLSTNMMDLLPGVTGGV